MKAFLAVIFGVLLLPATMLYADAQASANQPVQLVGASSLGGSPLLLPEHGQDARGTARIKEDGQPAQQVSASIKEDAPPAEAFSGASTDRLLTPEGLPATLQMVAIFGLLSLAPALVLMTTSFVRLSVVLSLLRQALGASQVPSNQVLTAIALFLTVVIVGPVWAKVYDTAVRPYTAREISGEVAWERGCVPLREFMSRQIDRAGNAEDVWLFVDYLALEKAPETYAEVPMRALVPAFLLSELQTAFLIGFQVFLPFLVIDLVVAAVLNSLGMAMVPPAWISIPFKLLLFVMVDGWHLVVQSLLQSFAVG